MNARSIRNKCGDISDFIQDNKLDVCSISETWLSGNEEKDRIVCVDVTPAGYKFEHKARVKGRGGGVAVIFKSSMTCRKKKISLYKTFELMEVVLSTATESVCIGVLYRPPSGSICDFMEELTQYLDSHTASSQKYVLMGDFNVHMDKQGADSNKLNDLLYSSI